MARRPGQGVETRGGWKTTLQHIMGGPPAASDGERTDVKGSKRAPHVPLKVRNMNFAVGRTWLGSVSSFETLETKGAR